MESFSFQVQNIIDGQGIDIALTGMSIVFTVLAIISTFIALLPKILALLSRYFPEEEPQVSEEARPSSDDGAVLAAIGYVMHLRRQNQA